MRSKLITHLNTQQIWMAQLPSLGSYSIEVLGTSEKDVLKKRRAEYNANWKHRPLRFCGGMEFDEIMDHNGGWAREITLGKIYIDGFMD